MTTQARKPSFIQRFGIGRYMYYHLYRRLEQYLGWRILNAIVLHPEDISSKLLQVPEGYEHRFVEVDEILSFARDCPQILEESFVLNALAKGDRCYGVFFESQLVAYGWYSNVPTEFDQKVNFHFSPEYIYMYNGYTLPEHRSNRLHGIAMAYALKNFCQQGYSALVSFVESHNFPSKRSCERLGYKNVGYLSCIPFAGRFFCFASKGCKPYEMRLISREEQLRPSELRVAG